LYVFSAHSELSKLPAEDPVPSELGMNADFPVWPPGGGIALYTAYNAVSPDAAPYHARFGLGQPLASSTSGSAGVRATWKALPRRVRAAPTRRCGEHVTYTRLRSTLVTLAQHLAEAERIDVPSGKVVAVQVVVLEGATATRGDGQKWGTKMNPTWRASPSVSRLTGLAPCPPWAGACCSTPAFRLLGSYLSASLRTCGLDGLNG